MHPPHPSLLAGCCVFEPLSSAACNINLFESPSIRFRGWLLCCSPPRGHRPSINSNWICWCVAASSSFSSSIAPMQLPQRPASVNKLIVMLLRCCWCSSNCIRLDAHHTAPEVIRLALEIHGHLRVEGILPNRWILKVILNSYVGYSTVQTMSSFFLIILRYFLTFSSYLPLKWHL